MWAEKTFSRPCRFSRQALSQGRDIGVMAWEFFLMYSQTCPFARL